MNLRKYFIIDPCSKKGNCLVRASCRLFKNTPWERGSRCPRYAKYKKLDDRIDSFVDITSSVFWGLVFLSICASLIIALLLGYIREYELIKGWIFNVGD
jgi:hypothetical protein